MRQTIIIIALCFLGFVSKGQEVTCFGEFMQGGEQAIDDFNYQLAIRLFEAARACPDISGTQDSLASTSIIKANDIWRNSLQRAIDNAKFEKNNAIKAEAAMRLALDTAEINERIAIAATLLANRRADQAEASRLAMLSMEQTDDGSPSDALLLGLVAMDIMEDTLVADVWRAFGNAAFENYAVRINDMNGGVLDMDFDAHGWSYTARSSGGEFRFYEDDKLVFKNQTKLILGVSLPSDIERNIITVASDSMTHVSDRQGSNVADLADHNTLFTDVSYSPNNESFVSIGRDFSMEKWSSLSDPPIRFVGHTAPIQEVVFSIGGELILSRSLDKSVRLWNEDGGLVANLDHGAYVTSTSFSSIDNTFLSTSSDGKIYLWDAEGSLLAEMQHGEYVTSASFLPNGKSILTTSTDGTARIWNLNGQEQFKVELNGSSIVSSEIANDGKRVLLVTGHGLAVLCDGQLNSIISIEEYQNHSGFIEAHLSHNGLFVLTSDDNGAVRLWNDRGEEVMSPPLFEGYVWGSGFTPNGEKIWACSEDGNAWVCTLPSIMYQGIKDGMYPIPEPTDKFKRKYGIRDSE